MKLTERELELVAQFETALSMTGGFYLSFKNEAVRELLDIIKRAAEDTSKT